MSKDTIYRQAAIEAIHEDADWLAAQGSDWQIERMERDKSILKALPSAEPERKTGKWDFMGWQMFQCSECKHTFTQDFLEGWREYTYESHFPPFCPNCGSYNGGEQDG